MSRKQANKFDYRWYVEVCTPAGHVVNRYYVDQCIPKPKDRKCVDRVGAAVRAHLKRLSEQQGFTHKIVREGDCIEQPSWLRGGVFFELRPKADRSPHPGQRTIDLGLDPWPSDVDDLPF